MKNLLILLLFPLLGSCQQAHKPAKFSAKKTTYAVVKTDAEWQEILSPLAYQVLRKAATERAFSGPLNNNKKAGTYVCAGCKSPSMLPNINTILDRVGPPSIAEWTKI